MHDAVIYLTTSRDPATRSAAAQAAHAWQDQHTHGVASCLLMSGPAPRPPFDRCMVLLVRASTDALAAVPSPFTVERLALSPRRLRAAIVRDVAYDSRGRLVRGMSRFAPGTQVYVAGPYSGDGYERTMMIGRDRDTTRYIVLMGATARLKQWHLADVTEPEALFVLRSAAGDWEYHFISNTGLSTMLPPVAWQPPEAWGPLVARWFAPERPRLAACAAAVLGCEHDEALAWIEQGTLERQLIAAQKGRCVPAVLRSSIEAWRALAPPAWQADAVSRSFARRDLGAPGAEAHALPRRARPGSMHATVAFCSGPDGVEAAEALAREIAATLRPAASPAVVWHFVRRSEIGARLQPDPCSRGDDGRTAAGAAALLDAMRALTVAIARDDDGAAQERVSALRAAAAAGSRRDPSGPLLALITHGYALLDVTDDGAVHLACPL